MSEVQIFTIENDMLSAPPIGDEVCTDMVRHSDYTELEDKHKALVAKMSMIAELSGALEQANKLAQEATEKLVQERNALAAENAGLNKYITQSCYVFDGEQHEISDAYICATDGGIPETPATDAFLDDLREQAHKEGAHFVANRMLATWDAGFIDDTAKNAADIARMILTSTEFMADAPEGDFDRSFADGVLEDIAAQLRKGDAQ